jgi:hypothetical protein
VEGGARRRRSFAVDSAALKGRISFESYALNKMRIRNITKQEVLEVLEAPRSQHWYNRKHCRMNVRSRASISGKMLLVSYDRRGDITVVVNAMWD